jgi:hypothetical protein
MSAAEREMELQHSGDVASRKVQVYDSQDSSVKQNNELKAKLAAARATYERFRKDLYTKHPSWRSIVVSWRL